MSASHCVAEWRRVCVITAAMIQPACGQSECSHPVWSHKNNITEILPRGGEGRERRGPHRSIINFCLLENSSFSHEKNMLFPVLCGHSIIFFARGKSGFIYQSITSHVWTTIGQMYGNNFIYQHLGLPIKWTRFVSAQFIS